MEEEEDKGLALGQPPHSLIHTHERLLCSGHPSRHGWAGHQTGPSAFSQSVRSCGVCWRAPWMWGTRERGTPVRDSRRIYVGGFRVTVQVWMDNRTRTGPPKCEIGRGEPRGAAKERETPGGAGGLHGWLRDGAGGGTGTVLWGECGWEATDLLSPAWMGQRRWTEGLCSTGPSSVTRLCRATQPTWRAGTPMSSPLYRGGREYRKVR
ncbi:uncharacterized protein LOC111820156 [Trichechus manatus latirostris]|uniref:Uncharacterized protein LOC111820156 n=1 Tax=Trichechus manatus latirostris TaxID=127582 RepID=A0A2Y9QSG2_TRIMA|nr:uncharacterized protein LOC111820156 [Trichechus manatus latirostris]